MTNPPSKKEMLKVTQVSAEENIWKDDKIDGLGILLWLEHNIVDLNEDLKCLQ